jgi:hypothetical protein
MLFYFAELEASGSADKSAGSAARRRVRFVVPPLPGERLLTPKEVAQRAACHVTAIYNFINDGKLAVVTIADRQLVPESEADRFIGELPSRNRGVSARWREYRAWKANRRAAKPVGAQS